MRFRFLGAVAAVAVLTPLARPDDLASAVDRSIDKENQGRKVQVAPPVEDLAFLRRATVDLTGVIPSEDEIQRFLSWPAAERRARLIDRLLQSDRFADRWTVFFGDMFRIRSNAEGGGAFLAFTHRAVEANLPYDQMVRQLIAATGKANATPEVGFLLGDNADPMSLAGVTSQVFLGIRVSCAQCHNHPFDQWTRKQFYDLAAFFGKTRRIESRLNRNIVYVTETEQNSILWPPDDKSKASQERKPVKAAFPFPLDEADGPRQHIARLTKLRAELEALAQGKKPTGPSIDDLIDDASKKIQNGSKPSELDVATEARNQAKNLQVEKDVYRASQLRSELAQMITDPRNRAFSRNLVNRTWAELVGFGFVEPVDDFRDDNPASHPETLDLLADEFVAHGYDFRWLVRTILSTQAYQRGHLAPTVDNLVRTESERAFTAAKVRRVLSETLFDSIVQAGHLFDVKHVPGTNVVTVRTTVREAIPLDGEPKKLEPKPLDAKPVAKAPPPSAYDLERAIEVDFKAVLKKKDDLPVEAMQAMSNEEIEAMQMMKERPADGKRYKYVTRVVETQIDDNPRYSSSMRLAAPAPPAHFLRVFGQPGRDTLEDRRDSSASMRQALMMLNGKLTHEAARVGPLEPLHALLTGPKADLNAAVQLAYREILTRAPTAAELTEAVAILRDADTPADGMADLRWVLFNCHEFRFLP